MDLRISKEKEKQIIATIIMFASTMLFLFSIGLSLYQVFLGTRSKSYADLVSSLINKATSTNTDPMVLKMLARAMVLHFQDIGLTKKGIKIDTLINEVLNKDYSNLLYSATDKGLNSARQNVANLGIATLFTIIMCVVFLAVCIKIHQTNDKMARNKFQKKRAAILFISLAAITATAGGIIIAYAKTQGITLTQSNILKLAGKLDQILPDTVNALHAHGGTLDPQHMKSFFVTYLNSSIKTYDQFNLTTILFGAMVGCFMLSAILIFASLVSLLNSRGEVINNDDYEEISPPPYQTLRSTENDPPSYQQLDAHSNNQSNSANASDEQAPNADVAVQPNSALPLPTQAPPDYDDPNYTSYTPNAQADISYIPNPQTDTLPPPYQQLDPNLDAGHNTTVPVFDSPSHDYDSDSDSYYDSADDHDPHLGSGFDAGDVSDAESEDFSQLSAELVPTTTTSNINNVLRSLIPTIVSSRLYDIATQLAFDYLQENSMPRRNSEIFHSLD